jgi:hypothetical protein
MAHIGAVYKFQLNPTFASLYYFAPGANSGARELAKYTLPKALVTGDTALLELRMQGDRLTGLVNGMKAFDIQDSSSPGPGEWGMTASDGWYESVEVQSPPGAASAPAAAVAPLLLPDGSEDLLAPLTPEAVAQTGQGWTLQDGKLLCPAKKRAVLPLPGNFADSSYQMRIRLRKVSTADVFALILPVRDRKACFELDGFSSRYTGLHNVNGKNGKDVPGFLESAQVKDAEPHELEATVRPAGENVTITTRLDGRPLYEWTGPIASLSPDGIWDKTPPGSPGLGGFGPDASGWEVSGVKVKRLGPAAASAAAPRLLPDGSEDLLATLTPDTLAQAGGGWRLENGALTWSQKGSSFLPLLGDLAGSSYQVHVKAKRLVEKQGLLLFLPVGDGLVGAILDGYPETGFYSGLSTVNGLANGAIPGMAAGKRVNDSELHDFDLSVQQAGANVAISGTLDAKPLFAWSGPSASLGLHSAWKAAPPHSLTLRILDANWVVSELRVKRLGPAATKAAP